MEHKMSSLEEEMKELKAGLKQTSTGQARREASAAAAAAAKTTTDTAVRKTKETEPRSQDAVSTCNQRQNHVVKVL